MCLTARALAFALFATVPIAAGDVSGRIVITKRLPKRRVDPVANSYHRGAVVAPAPVIEDFATQELERVAVFIEDIHERTSPVTVELGQKNRKFIPEVVVIPAGSTVSFPNFDPLFHNVFSLAKPRRSTSATIPRTKPAR